MECSQPAGEQHWCHCIAEWFTFTYFNLLSGYNSLLFAHKNMKLKFSRLNVACDALSQQVNNTVVTVCCCGILSAYCWLFLTFNLVVIYCYSQRRTWKWISPGWKWHGIHSVSRRTSLLCVVVAQWLLLTTFKHFIWSYFILTATEEHENKVPQNEGGTECSLPGVNNKKSDSGTWS